MIRHSAIEMYQIRHLKNMFCQALGGTCGVAPPGIQVWDRSGMFGNYPQPMLIQSSIHISKLRRSGPCPTFLPNHFKTAQSGFYNCTSVFTIKRESCILLMFGTLSLKPMLNFIENVIFVFGFYLNCNKRQYKHDNNHYSKVKLSATVFCKINANQLGFYIFFCPVYRLFTFQYSINPINRLFTFFFYDIINCCKKCFLCINDVDPF